MAAGQRRGRQFAGKVTCFLSGGARPSAAAKVSAAASRSPALTLVPEVALAPDKDFQEAKLLPELHFGRGGAGRGEGRATSAVPAGSRICRCRTVRRRCQQTRCLAEQRLGRAWGRGGARSDGRTAQEQPACGHGSPRGRAPWRWALVWARRLSTGCRRSAARSLPSHGAHALPTPPPWGREGASRDETNKKTRSNEGKSTRSFRCRPIPECNQPNSARAARGASQLQRRRPARESQSRLPRPGPVYGVYGPVGAGPRPASSPPNSGGGGPRRAGWPSQPPAAPPPPGDLE